MDSRGPRHQGSLFTCQSCFAWWFANYSVSNLLLSRSALNQANAGSLLSCWKGHHPLACTTAYVGQLVMASLSHSCAWMQYVCKPWLRRRRKYVSNFLLKKQQVSAIRSQRNSHNLRFYPSNIASCAIPTSASELGWRRVTRFVFTLAMHATLSSHLNIWISRLIRSTACRTCRVAKRQSSIARTSRLRKATTIATSTRSQSTACCIRPKRTLSAAAGWTGITWKLLRC